MLKLITIPISKMEMVIIEAFFLFFSFAFNTGLDSKGPESLLISHLASDGL